MRKNRNKFYGKVTRSPPPRSVFFVPVFFWENPGLYFSPPVFFIKTVIILVLGGENPGFYTNIPVFLNQIWDFPGQKKRDEEYTARAPPSLIILYTHTKSHPHKWDDSNVLEKSAPRREKSHPLSW